MPSRLRISRTAPVLIAGQAPGIRVHESGTPYEVLAGVAVRVRVAVDVGLTVAVPVGVEATWASVGLSGSVLKLATINRPRRVTSASRLNTGVSECHRCACLSRPKRNTKDVDAVATRTALTPLSC